MVNILEERNFPIVILIIVVIIGIVGLILLSANKPEEQTVGAAPVRGPPEFVEFRGKVLKIIVDDFVNKKSSEKYLLEVSDNEHYELETTETTPVLEPQSFVKIKGKKSFKGGTKERNFRDATPTIEEWVLLESSSGVEGITGGAIGVGQSFAVSGTHNVAVLVAKRPGYETPTLEQVREMIKSDVKPSFNKGYRDVSYGIFGFDGDAVMCETEDYGCCFICYTDKMKCPGGKGGQHKMYLIPGCGGGLAEMPGKLSWVGGGYGIGTVTTGVHELGHNLGMGHANLRVEVGKGTWDSIDPYDPLGIRGGSYGILEYGDRYDVMGSGNYNQLGLPNRLFLGFIPLSDLKQLYSINVDKPASSGDYFITALKNPPFSSDPHGLDIFPKGDYRPYPPKDDAPHFFLSYIGDGYNTGKTLVHGGYLPGGQLGGGFLWTTLTDGVSFTDTSDIPYTFTQISHEDDQRAKINVVIPPMPPILTPSCNDPDGDNPYTKATTCDAYRCLTDYCSDRFHQNEILCGRDNRITGTGYDCTKFGTLCVDGACVSPEPQVCTDSDGGKVYTVKGTTTGPSIIGVPITITDECYYNYNYIREGYCNREGRATSERKACPRANPTCADGACV